MSTYTIQPLESYRLGAYQLPLPCYLCDSGNLFDAVSCRNCGAPMEMMRIAAGSASRFRPQIIPTLGAGNVGKTVYLGMLIDILARENEELEFMTCDAASISLQQESISVLARGEFPSPTVPDPQQWRWAHCRIRRRTSKVFTETFMLDVSGSSIMDELEHPGTFPVISGMIRRATGAILIVDVDRVNQGDKDEEFFSLKILGHMHNVLERSWQQTQQSSKGSRWGRKQPKSLHPNIPPLSIVQMKADMCPDCFDDPAEYARGQMPNLWQFCKERFPNHQYFAASAIGACALMPDGRGRHEAVALRVEPRGIMAPFRWQFSQFIP